VGGAHLRRTALVMQQGPETGEHHHHVMQKPRIMQIPSIENGETYHSRAAAMSKCAEDYGS
jgi:hypothetical protein